MSAGHASPAQRLSNGYILPEGTLTPNTVFVGGIDVDVDERELCNIFSRFGAVKEVKLINYTRGTSRKYGFVYFKDDVNISTLIEQEISFKGQILKLGPAITKSRCYRSRLHCQVCQVPWAGTPSQCFYMGFCPSMGGGVAQPSSGLNGCPPYNQPYSYSNGAGAAAPQMPMNYAHPYAYQCPPAPWMLNQRTQPVNQNFVDCGVQTIMTLL
ncbi:deleted in azoospermia-like [Genypterus blacodes]|uniref:deleted in azoospermia-like n=1 Tax=Genypterus blacodes TaxID=154954 RepID=UPI003F75B682